MLSTSIHHCHNRPVHRRHRFWDAATTPFSQRVGPVSQGWVVDRVVTFTRMCPLHVQRKKGHQWDSKRNKGWMEDFKTHLSQSLNKHELQWSRLYIQSYYFLSHSSVARIVCALSESLHAPGGMWRPFGSLEFYVPLVGGLALFPGVWSGSAVFASWHVMLAVLCQLACHVSSALPVGMFCFCKMTCPFSSAMHSQDVLLSGKASRNMQLKK